MYFTFLMISRIRTSSREKIRRHLPPYFVFLLLAEGLAVSALILGRSSLVGAHQNAVQRAEVCILAVMLALLNSALNRLVCMAIHRVILLILMIALDYPRYRKTYISITLAIDFFYKSQYNICGICEFSQICIMKDGKAVFEKKGILP